MLGEQEEKIISELVQLAKNGDEGAFNNLYQNYITPIYRYIFWRLKDTDETEEIVQQVFLKAWQSLPRYQERGRPFLAWLYTITRNSIYDHWKRKKNIILDKPLEDVPEKYELPDNNPGRILEQKEEKEIIRKAISFLSADQQEVVVLKFLNGYSNQEISLLLSKKEEAIRQLQCRAIKSLRKYFKNHQVL